MSDNEYERFEITDYDLDNEFNINRPRRRTTKHQQIYGIWADDSDNESEGEAGGRRGRRGLGGGSTGKSKDYTAPVSFVAGGIQQSGKKQKKKPEEKGSEEAENDGEGEESEGEEVRPSFGRQLSDDNSNNSSTDEDEKSRQAARNSSKNSIAGMRHNSHLPSSRNVGAWEQHTRGIGAKLLLQMGYEPGKGLGKDLQGISQPVQAHVRKGRGAIGAYGPEVAASIGGQGPGKQGRIEDEARESKESKEQQNKWRKGGGETREKHGKRYYYKSVEEVIAKGKKSDHLLGEKLSKRLGNVPVIDMTGPERRVLSGYHALAQNKITPEETLYEAQEGEQKSAPASVFSMPELTHNVQLLVSQCEQEIIAIDKTERECADRQAALQHEQFQLQELVQLERNHMTTLQEALARLDQLSENPELSLVQAEQLFLELQQDYAAEYKEFGMADLAAGVIAPLLKRELSDWQPLEQPTQPLQLIKRWRGILQRGESEELSRNVFDPYSSLIWAGVMPSFRSCAASWQPKEHAPMAALLDAWAPLLPTWVLDSVLEQLVLPRLTLGVQEWDPLTDTVPIHSWILPWHGILGSKLAESIYPQIRSKLGVALQAWSPQDRSARAMLTPWREAFAPDEQLLQFLLRHIIPKLQAVLAEFVINPLQQNLELWHQVWEWHELIPAPHMAQLLDKHFFPRWMQVLVMWLNQSPDYAEISRWYAGWKNMFSEDILREPCIKEHLRRALEMLHRATDAVLQTTSAPPPPMPPAPAPVLLTPVMLVDVVQPAQLEFKELVSQKCAEMGIIFAPLPGRRELGKQIYRVGKLFCYIDRNVCMLSDSSFTNWQPVGLTQLLERAQTGII
ncbi:septin-interacting protein 1 [Drosophila albomicans]|uniref:Septin-interacting protein 1 n=1 Tax=Drosophila albomicans TaxID=7291 RepID=A0A6P8W8V6_DROAB|nr:septin-interacting protein 1 [Drosophila albomicans]